LKKYLIILFLFSITAWSQYKAVVDSITYYDNNDDFIKVLSFIHKTKNVYLKQKKYPEYCAIAIRESVFYNKLKQPEKSSKVLFEAYKIIENKQMPLEKALLFQKIGRLNATIQNFPKSISYYKRASQQAIKNKNDTLLAGLYSNLAYSYLNYNNNIDSSSYYIKKSFLIYKIKGDNSQKGGAYNNMAAYYFSSNNFEIGKKYSDSSLVFAKISKNKRIINNCLANLAYYYTVFKQDHKKAEKIYLEQLRNYDNDTLTVNTADTYLNLSYVYEQLKDYKSAILFLEKNRICSIEANDIELSRQVNGVETRYKIQKKADEFKAKVDRLKEVQKKKQLFFIIVIVGLIMLIILFAVFYQFNKLKQKNKLNAIESDLKENLINATIDGQEIERKNVATVLHDNVSALLSSAGLQLMAFSATETTKSEEITKARAIIKDAHDKVRDLSHQLVPTLLAKFGLIYALHDLCEKNSNSMITIDFESNLNSKTRFDEDYEMKLYFIISEMINNVLKHSKASNANVIINQENEMLIVTVSDNGHGFEIAKDKSYEGFGLTQIRARINNLKGKLIIVSAKGKGTTVQIQVPIIEKPSTPIT
jgi:signal transduction histidine kinase